MLRSKTKKMKGEPFAITWMRFPGFRSVEQTEKRIRRIRDCLSFFLKKKEKMSDCNNQAFIPNAPTIN